MKKILTLICILAIPFMISAEEMNLVWQTSWGGSNIEFFNSTYITSDNKILVVGNTQSSDIEGISSYGERDALIVKYDEKGNLLWQKSWGGDKMDFFTSVIEGFDGYYYVLGSSHSTNINGISNKGSSDIVFLKYDKNGNLIFQKNYGGSDEENAIQILETNDGFIFLINYWSKDIENVSNNGKTDGLLIKVNKNGEIIWKKSWGGNLVETFHKMIIDENNNIIIIGEYNSTDILNHPNSGYSDGVIIKFDENGDIIWTKTLNGSSSDRFIALTKTDDNCFVVYVKTNSKNIEGIEKSDVLIKYDENGNVVWMNDNKNHEDKTDMFIESIIPSKDNSLISVGVFNRIEKINESNVLINDGVITKYDKDGNILYKKVYKGTKNIKFSSIITDKNNDFIVNGYIYYQEIPGLLHNGEIDALLLKYSYKYNMNISENITNGTASTEQINSLGIVNPIPDEGYEVDKIIVKNTKDEIIEVTALEDGTYSFPLNDDVTIEVLFKEVLSNPKTGVFDYISFILIGLLICIIGYVSINYNNQKYEF